MEIEGVSTSKCKRKTNFFYLSRNLLSDAVKTSVCTIPSYGIPNISLEFNFFYLENLRVQAGDKKENSSSISVMAMIFLSQQLGKQ